MYMSEVDCFAFVEDESIVQNHCKALKELVCIGGRKCPFYKTDAQLKLENERTAKRLFLKGGEPWDELD